MPLSFPFPTPQLFPSLPVLSSLLFLCRALRLCWSWAESRDVFNNRALQIRAEFDANKTAGKATAPLLFYLSSRSISLPRDPFPTHHSFPISDAPRAARLLREGNERLVLHTHPDPYIAAYMPGGSLFMRNPAIPLEAIYPEGIPEGVSNRRVNIDFSNVPDDQPWANKVFVDSANKKYTIDN